MSDEPIRQRVDTLQVHSRSVPPPHKPTKKQVRAKKAQLARFCLKCKKPIGHLHARRKYCSDICKMRHSACL